MPADNWKSIWKSTPSKCKQKNRIRLITGYYLKQHKKTKQVRLVQWLKDCRTQECFYANIPISHLIDLKNSLESMGKRVRKRGKSGTV